LQLVDSCSSIADDGCEGEELGEHVEGVWIQRFDVVRFLCVYFFREEVSDTDPRRACDKNITCLIQVMEGKLN
jgi:hypothetical protein